MNAADELAKANQQKAAARFMLRIGQVGRATEDYNETRYLFPLHLLMDAEGVLANDAKHLTA